MVNRKENGNHDIVYRGYIAIREKNGNYYIAKTGWGYIGIMEKKMETPIL